MIFQKEIKKTLDVRATIVGQQIFAAAVDAQGNELTQLDWRRKGRDLLRAWQPYELPEQVKEKLLQMQAFFGLNYGAADFVLSAEGELFFLAGR